MWRPFPRLHVRSLRKLHVQTLAYVSDSPPLTHPALRVFKIIVDGETMSRSALLMAGIILITIPTIQYGGYFLLTSLMKSRQRIMDNPLRQNFFRAGHAHAGVIVILSLICQLLADFAVLPASLVWVIRVAVPLSAILISAGFFL